MVDLGYLTTENELRERSLTVESLIVLYLEHTGFAQKELWPAVDYSQAETLAVIVSNLSLKPLSGPERHRHLRLGINQRS